MQAADLQCVRCAATYPLTHHAEDCPACRGSVRANLTVRYGDRLSGRRERPSPAVAGSMWRFADALPVARAAAVTMGEGGTPLTPLPRVAASLGVAQLLAKDETRNPTWSFKDRLASSAISAAKALGARVIASSSSGNAGAAAAAYAARAGLPCIVFTFQGTAGPMLTQMRAYGAMVVATGDKADRWRLLEHGVREFGWFPTSPFFGPAVGSNPFGIEGYKTLAYEVAEQLDWQVPDWCVLPICYGDAMVGMWKGFLEMQQWGWIERAPRMIAAEIYGSFGQALADDLEAPPPMPKTHDTLAVSIGATQGTFQALDVLRRSGGCAVSVGNADLLRWQATLASQEGLYGEPSSVAPFAAVEQLRNSGVIGAGDRVVTLFTAAGLKDPEATARTLPALALVDGNFATTLRALEEHYGFDARSLRLP